ncbi:MAG TPA: FKBP-type peptidyl-prolyl cis-trans isomerase [Brumimicrobium sp.]|nr:FKBP-type peptidyl-prolyl cis-trans isomerase [Brumimicrobium sp.]
MKILYTCLLFLFVLMSCDIKGVETSEENDETEVFVEDSVEKEMDTVEPQIKTPEKASDTLKLDNGIVITYFKKGTGEKLKKGDMIKIDYRSKLEDGTIYDGNHLVKKTSIPFLVGWNQQTEGWGLAIKELRVGDDVDIFLPSKYARGEKGIKGIVPPNSNNILSLRILEKFEPTVEVDDIQIWKYDELKEPGDSIGFNDEVYLNYWVSSESTPRYDNNYKRGETFNLVMGDGNIVPGLYKALHFGREGDRLMIKIPAKEAYGSKGLLDLVKPNEDIFYDVQIGKVIKSK